MTLKFKQTITGALLLLPLGAFASTGTDLGSSAASAAQNATNTTITTSAAANMGASATPGENPADGVTSASAAQSTSLIVQCPVGTSFDKSPIVYPLGMATQCVNNSGSLLFRVCEGTPQGVDCTANKSWEQQYLGAGQSLPFSSTLTVGLQSCTGTACTINVQQTGSFSGTGTDLSNQGVALAQKQASNDSSPTNEVNNVGLLNTTTGQMAQVGTSKNGANYAANVIANGGSMTSCFNTQQSQLSNGKDVFTCDGSQSVNFGASCASTTTCTKYANTTTNYTQTCVDAVKNHEIDMETVTPTVACTITNPTETFSCSKTAKPNVVSTTVSDCPAGAVKFTIFPFNPGTISNYTSRPISFSWNSGGTRNDAYIRPLVATCTGSNQLYINGLSNSMGNKSDSFDWPGDYVPSLTMGYSAGGDGSTGGTLYQQIDGNVFLSANINCTSGHCTVSSASSVGAGGICGPAGFATETITATTCRDPSDFPCTPHSVCTDWNDNPCTPGDGNIGCTCQPNECTCSSVTKKMPSTYYCNDGSKATTPVPASDQIPKINGVYGVSYTATVDSVTRAKNTYQFDVSRKTQALSNDTTTDGCTAYEAAQ